MWFQRSNCYLFASYAIIPLVAGVVFSAYDLFLHDDTCVRERVPISVQAWYSTGTVTPQTTRSPADFHE